MLGLRPPNVERLAEKADVEGLIKALNYDRDPAIRAAAAQALAAFPSADVQKALREILTDPAPEVRQAAVRSLAAVGKFQATEALIAALADEDDAVAQEAAMSLATIKDPRAVSPLIQIVRSGKRPYLREAALDALKTIGPAAARAAVPLLYHQDAQTREAGRAILKRMGAAAIPTLRPYLSDENRDLRWRLVEVVGEIEGEEATAFLVQALQDRDYYVREAAIAALAVRGETSIPPVADLLRLESVALREAAITILERIGTPAVVVPLLTALEAVQAKLRSQAALALSKTGDPRAIQALNNLLVHDDDTMVRRDAVEALKRLRDPSSLDAFVRALSDRDYVVRQKAAEAIKALGWEPDQSETAARYWASQGRWERCVPIGEPAVVVLLDYLLTATSSEQRLIRNALERIGAVAVPHLLHALQAPQKALRVEAAGLLARIAGQEALEPLLQALQDPERSVREAAATALGEIKDPRAIPALVEALKDWEPNVQEAAAKALSVFGEQVLPDVLPLLKAEDWHARQGAVMALGYSSLEQATQILLPIFRNDPERNVRNAAMEALKRLQAASVEAFIAMLYDPDIETRQKAIAALGDMRDRRAEEPLLSLLWDEDQAIRTAAFGALQRLGVFDPIALSTPPRTSHLYVMVCSPRDLPPDEWSEIAHQALMELGEQAPALQWVHATVLSDFSRLHESFYRFEPSERAFQGLVKAFQEWILSEGGTIAEWEARFFHRELADLPDLEEVDAILFYYQP